MDLTTRCARRGPAAILALALLPVMSHLAFAGVEFAPPASYALSQPATAVTLGDLDGDGDLDAAVGSGFAHAVGILLNQGNGAFHLISPVDAPEQADVVLANIDGDGYPDLVVAGVDGSLSVFHGNGDGSFTAAFSLALGHSATDLTAADLNGDGLDDLAVLGSFDPHAYEASLAVLVNQKGSFVDPTVYDVEGGARSIEAGDLNGDQVPDLVTGNYSSSATVFLNHGDGTLDPSVTYPATGYISCAAIGDLDGDGDADLSVSDENGTMNALLNDGHGAFHFAGNTRLYGRALCAAVADFDGDGNADVAVSRDDLGQVIALAGKGDGTFKFPALYFATGMGANGIATGDVNGDGHPDLVTADMGGHGSGGSMSVLLSGTPRSCRRNDLNSGVGASGLASADFNADGAPDLATTNEDNTLTVLLNDGLGGFASGQLYPLGTLSQNLSAGDLDGDSRADLVASNFGESTVTLYYNQGDGSFSHGRDLRVGPHPRWVEVADLDADGRLDLVTGNYNDAIHNGSVSVLIGLGGRAFARPVTYEVGVGPYMVRAANLNQDEMPDLVVNNYDGQTVSILINRGDGTFAPEVRYYAGWNLSSAVGDFDHDGDNDVAVTNFKENTVTVFRNDGNGVLTRYADVPVGRNPRSIQAAIIKGDGDIDLAVALSGTSEVILLANDGVGGFTGSASACIVGVNPKTLIVGDFDRNAGQDLATANNGAGTVSILPDVGPPGSAMVRAAMLKRQRKFEAGAAGEGDARFALAASRPNPARGEAFIPFEIAREGPVELRIYDVAGRVVKTLVSGTLPAGPHEARWDGTNDRGYRASPGTYFYRLRAGDERAVRTLMLH
jgi:hypothetical protein